MQQHPALTFFAEIAPGSKLVWMGQKVFVAHPERQPYFIDLVSGSKIEVEPWKPITPSSLHAL